MFFDTRPAPTDSMDEFRLTDAAEIRSLLKALMDRNVVINLSASDGTACSSTLWSIDGTQRKLSFSVDPHSPSSQRWSRPKRPPPWPISTRSSCSSRWPAG